MCFYSSLTENFRRLVMVPWDSIPRSVPSVIAVRWRPSLRTIPRNPATWRPSWASKLVWPTLSVRSNVLVQREVPARSLRLWPSSKLPQWSASVWLATLRLLVASVPWRPSGPSTSTWSASVASTRTGTYSLLNFSAPTSLKRAFGFLSWLFGSWRSKWTYGLLSWHCQSWPGSEYARGFVRFLLSALIFLADLGHDETKVLAFVFNVFSLTLKMKV